MTKARRKIERRRLIVDCRSAVEFGVWSEEIDECL